MQPARIVVNRNDCRVRDNRPTGVSGHRTVTLHLSPGEV
jgi:hypothetical protein